ncbi:hypothetical protein GGQ65_003561 [Rhizobium fabae]|uniref:Uncharacterized protein n=1 Tax=Rhizobium fabae TaxID=573179 RepID=A0A7W6BET2_9HYPH|nr:hypothetical protein [Rhizobium fabae]
MEKLHANVSYVRLCRPRPRQFVSETAKTDSTLVLATATSEDSNQSGSDAAVSSMPRNAFPSSRNAQRRALRRSADRVTKPIPRLNYVLSNIGVASCPSPSPPEATEDQGLLVSPPTAACDTVQESRPPPGRLAFLVHRNGSSHLSRGATARDALPRTGTTACLPPRRSSSR